MLSGPVSGLLALMLPLFFDVTLAFDVNCNSNYVSYYGQNSARNQQSLGKYCKDATEDVIILAFMNGFPNVLLNFANACETTFAGSTLLHCPGMAKDIKYCQSQGKVVVLSMGGASGAYGFSGESDGTAFADTMWNMFFKGDAAQRPFDDAVLDGVDLDIEGGSGAGYPAFIQQLRSHYATDTSKQYYIAAAPQCPFPDAYLGSTLNSAWFDMVYVQFYNNYCGLNAYPNWFNFGDWDQWAKTKSINKDVKVYIGAPGSPSAASSGYVGGSTLASIYNDVRAKYSSLGGIMTWDVSQARTSGIAGTIRSALDAGGTCKKPDGGHSSTTTTEASTSSSSSTSSAEESTSSSTLTSSNDSDPDVTTVVTTSTEDVTAVSTFVTSVLTEITTASTYISHRTTVYTLTLMDEATSLTNSTELPTSSALGSTNTEPSTTDTDAPTTPTDSTDPAPLSDGCPVEGAPCQRLTQGCNRSGYVLCVNDRWALFPCFAQTSCYIYGTTGVCDWDNNRPASDRCSVQSIWGSLARPKRGLLSELKTDLRPISAFFPHGGSLRIEYVPLSASNGKYRSLVKLQALHEPFGDDWALHLELPRGQSIDNTNLGHVATSGSVASIFAVNGTGPAQNMAASFTIGGRYSQSFSIPDLTLARVDLGGQR